MADIIIVDDDPATLDKIREVLERSGHTIRQAANGKEGLQLVRKRPPHLVVTNLFMPVMNGIAMILEVRKKPDVKILALSGGSTLGPADFLHDAKLLRADATLAKPFTIEELQEKVDGLLQTG